MDIILTLPDDIARRLSDEGRDLPRRALEAFGLEEYRAARLTRADLLRVLGHATADELDTLIRVRHAEEAMSPAEIERAVLGAAGGFLSME